MIEEKSSKKRIWFLVALAVFFVPCIWCIFNVFQTDKTNTGCTPLPNKFSKEDLIGTWTAKSLVLGITDILYIQADGRYKQTIHISGPPKDINYEGDWQRWWFEPRSNGTGYLHLEGLRECAANPEDSCEWVNDGSIPQADVCESKWMEPDPVGESVLVVRGYPFPDSNEKVSRPFMLTLFRGFESSPWSYDFEKP
jgi:hypothetical protein